MNKYKLSCTVLKGNQYLAGTRIWHLKALYTKKSLLSGWMICKLPCGLLTYMYFIQQNFHNWSQFCRGLKIVLSVEYWCLYDTYMYMYLKWKTRKLHNTFFCQCSVDNVKNLIQNQFYFDNINWQLHVLTYRAVFLSDIICKEWKVTNKLVKSDQESKLLKKSLEIWVWSIISPFS